MKNRVEVVIAGNRFTMTGEQDEEYMTKIAALVDNRVCKIKESGASTLQAVLLTACDIADNYVQAVKGLGKICARRFPSILTRTRICPAICRMHRKKFAVWNRPRRKKTKR